MKVVLVLFHSIVLLVGAKDSNNACKNIADYDTKASNKNCWYNPDIDLSVPDIIRRHNYPLEIHEVITQDGYKTQLFRISHGKNQKYSNITRAKRQPVFLQHGLFSSSAPWVINGNESIGFILADEGYDVWLGNSRGSQYGKGHITLSPSDVRYWKFSFHEMGIYDMPKCLDLVTKITGRTDIIFIGQSMGTNIPLVYASELPDHAKKRLKLLVLLAPTVFFANAKTVLGYLAPYWRLLYSISKKYKLGEILSKEQFSNNMLASLCMNSGFQVMLCEAAMFSVFGVDIPNLSPEKIPVLMAHYPAGSSVRGVIHFAQSMVSGRFARYNYGPRLNFKYYNFILPPDYNLSKVNIPSYVMYSVNDWISSEEGATKLFKHLPNKIGLYKIKDRRYNHIDFFFAKNVMTEVVNNLLSVVNKYKN